VVRCAELATLRKNRYVSPGRWRRCICIGRSVRSLTDSSVQHHYAKLGNFANGKRRQRIPSFRHYNADIDGTTIARRCARRLGAFVCAGRRPGVETKAEIAWRSDRQRTAVGIVNVTANDTVM